MILYNFDKKEKMTTVAGIQIEKDTKGNDAFIRINLKKYGAQLQPFLEQFGVVKDLDDDFEKEWKNGITKEEFIKRVNKHIETLPWKK